MDNNERYPGWFVMWTWAGSRVVTDTSGPFRTKKEAQSYAREMSKVMQAAAPPAFQDKNVGTYYLWKNVEEVRPD